MKRKRKRSDSVLWQSPYTHRKIQKATWQHKNATKNFYYTTIADRLRTVSWGNDSHPTPVVKPDYGIPTFPLTANAVKSKGRAFKNSIVSVERLQTCQNFYIFNRLGKIEPHYRSYNSWPKYRILYFDKVSFCPIKYWVNY